MTTYDTTDRYALRALQGTNAVHDIDAGFKALRDDVSAKLTPYDAGVLASRPVSTPGTPGIAGRTYYATDTGQEFLDLGTSWREIPSMPGAWQALTLGSGITATAGGQYTPSARLEAGGIVRLKGAFTNTSGGGIAPGTTLATLPSGYRPTGAGMVLSVGSVNLAPSSLSAVGVSTSGALILVATLANNVGVDLNGLTFTTS